jgi:hypothetical protein
MVSGDLAGRERHTATLLGNGLVLVAAGFCCGGFGYESPLNTAELFDPASGT